MKRILLSALMFGAASLGVLAQGTSTCSVSVSDTLDYVASKGSNYLAISMNQINDGGSFGYAGYGQKYGAPDSVLLTGISFKGFVYAGSASPITYGVYMADGAGMPGTVVTTGTATMPLQAGFTGPYNTNLIDVTIDFGTGFYVEGDYIITLQNLSSIDMYLIRNADGDGAAENLGFTYYKGVSNPSFDGWYEVYPFGSGWNFDMYISPIVQHDFSATTSYTDDLCLGDTAFMEITVPLEDSTYFSKFYNPNFTSFTGLNETYQIDYADGSGATSDTNYLYAAGGTYTVSQDIIISSLLWSGEDVMISCSADITVADAAPNLGADVEACLGDDVTFDAGFGFGSYLWNTSETSTSILVSTSTFEEDSIYEYSVEVTTGTCSGSDTVYLSFGGLDIDLGSDTTLCLNQNITLDAGAFDSYSWNTGQTSQSIQVGPFVGAGTEEIILDVQSGNCLGTDTLLVTIDNCLGVNDLAFENNISVFPIPAKDMLTLTIDEFLINDPIEYTIFDASGSVVAKGRMNSALEEVNLVNLANGAYWVRFTSEGFEATKKIQIIK